MADYKPTSEEMDVMAEVIMGSTYQDIVRAFGGYAISPRVEREAAKTMTEGAEARDIGISRHDCPYQYPQNIRRSWWIMGWIERDRELTDDLKHVSPQPDEPQSPRM